MTVKVVDNLSNADYHAHSAISKSGLDEINKSPLHYWTKYLAPEKPPVVWTDAFTVGAALHSLVLEPQNFDNEFTILPEINRRTKVGREEYEQFEKDNKDKILVKPDQYSLCQRMTQAIEEHPEASSYLDGFGKAETSIFFEWDGVPCRCRPDYIREDGVIVDVKTANCAHPTIWPRKAFDLRYHVQAAFYSEGYKQAFGEKPKGFVFVAVEKLEPFGVTVFKSSNEFLAAGKVDSAKDIQTFKQCKLADNWPGYAANEVMDLDIPHYARKKYMEVLG